MKICAVVVTYNRLSELKKCINSLKMQTRKLDSILVINNSSTDGTLNWLKVQEEIEFSTQPNLGGAGGFHTGIKIAYEKGFDWVWCMDDDGYPLRDCLENLVRSIKLCTNIDIVGPLVVPMSKSNILSFQTPFFDNNCNEKSSTILVEEIKKRAVNNLYKCHAVFFNGVLINKNTIVKVGFPEEKFFMYGDEIEYYQRIIENGFGVFTNIEALFIHPMNKFKIIKFLNQDIFDGKYDWKAYVYIRNRIYLHNKKYHGFALKFILSQLIYVLRMRKITVLKLVLLAYFHGINANFDYDYKELK
ncbi:MAG: glycosyltransferase family 2 protein [Melioribacteraceae bacterium]|nr:MAG: glycosyltransferase family 2 protein [Melioribacteraceae bacterium]